MAKHTNDDMNSKNIGSEVEDWLRNLTSSEDTEEVEEKAVPEEEDDDLSDIRSALNKVFEMCASRNMSIQVAMSDSRPADDGGDDHRLIMCGYLNSENLPCEMVAAAVVYQATHTFSHMVMALASAGASLLNQKGSEDSNHGNVS